LDDVDIFIAGHIGLSAKKLGEIYCGCTDFLAVNRIDAQYKGVAAHSGLAPERGKNALLTAAHAIVHLHTLPALVKGTKLNVGVMKSGIARNIISPIAEMELETRGDTDEANDEITQRAYQVLKRIAQIYGIESNTKLVGHAGCADCDLELVNNIRTLAEGLEGIDRVVELGKFGASEDATLMMKRVQKNGGQSTFLLFGSDIKGNHHEPDFDFNEKTLGIALATYISFIEKTLGC
jgi:aminobenzoyl-glutamate utilization protein A